MSAIQGTWREGRIILDEPVQWPEGRRVRVEPLAAEAAFGLSEEEWSDTPEAIADWLQWYDSLEPLEMTPEEEVRLADWRTQIKEHTIATMHEAIEGTLE